MYLIIQFSGSYFTGMVGVGWNLYETCCLIKKWLSRVSDGDRTLVRSRHEVFGLVARSHEVRAQGPWHQQAPVVTGFQHGVTFSLVL